MSDYVEGMVSYGVKLIHQHLVLHPQVSIMSIALATASLYNVHEKETSEDTQQYLQKFDWMITDKIG